MARKKLKVIVAGDRNCDDYEVVKEAIKASGFEIGEIVEGGARGIDALARKYSEEILGKPSTTFEAAWNDLDNDDEFRRIKSRWNKWKKEDQEYDAGAGFRRNQEMAEYGDACIAIQPNAITPGTNDMLERAKKAGLKTFVYGVKKDDKRYDHFF